MTKEESRLLFIRIYKIKNKIKVRNNNYRTNPDWYDWDTIQMENERDLKAIKFLEGQYKPVVK